MPTVFEGIRLPELHEIEAEICRRTLFDFVKEFWQTINTNEYTHNWHIEYLCDEVQLIIDKYVLNRKPHIKPDKWYSGMLDDIRKDGIFNVPPGSTKSTIITRMACAWLWANDDSKTIITSTIDSKNATEFSTTTRDILQSEKFRLFYPNVKIRRDVSAKTFYQSENGGKRYSLTTRGSKTGKHADLLIEDDPMDYETANSPQEAAQCIEGFKALQTRKKDKERCPYILVMQRLSSKDTTAHALKSLDNPRHICLPAEDVYSNIAPAELASYYTDGLLDPIRLNRTILEATKKGLGDDSKPISDIAYNIQFNQVSQSVDGLLYPIINVVDALPADRSNVIRLSFTDVADTGSDYFATPFAEINNGKIYVFDAIYTQEGSAITSPLIKFKIEQHGSMINMMETNNQGSVYITMLHAQGLAMNGYTNTGNKEARITAFAQFMPFINFVKPDPVTQPQYNAALKHLQAYPKVGKAEDGHDDIEDAVTELIRYIYQNFKYLFGL